MKSNYRILYMLLAAVFLTLAPGCNNTLEEHPYTVFTSDYFKTPDGYRSSVYSAYAGLRFNFGPNGAMAITNVGTDEWTYGDQPATGADPGVLQEGTYNISTSDGNILTPWNRNFWQINSCNAVVDFATSVTGMPPAEVTLRVAEARYLRAQYYLLLVQQFGAVNLDLGSGDLKFNKTPSLLFQRLPTDQLLAKDYQAMIDDLTFASQNLPDTRDLKSFKLCKAAALHLLAKVYLFRGYSAAAQSDDFQNAYTTANQLIVGAATTYGVALQQNFADVHKEGNDYNTEILFSSERLPGNTAVNEVAAPGNFDALGNIANNMFNCNYQSGATVGGVALYVDRPLQYGRPLRRYVPTKYLLETAFKDRKNDSRFDGSFRMVWYAATLNAAGTSGYTSYAAQLATIGLNIGDTVIYLTQTDKIADSLKALTGAQKKKYFIAGPKNFYSNQNTALTMYPNLKKYDDTHRAAANDVSGRPFIVSKLSETYLIAAEAAMKAGHVSDATTLINVLKKRAAYRPGLSDTEINNRYDKIKVSDGDITLDFILEERTRELAGESIRWPDLAVRGKLVERVKLYNPDAQNIQDFHVLRPIPQSELNAISDVDKAQYQNPGY